MFARSPSWTWLPTMSKDTLSEVLRSVRLRGALFFHVEGRDRWASEAPHASEIARYVMPGIEHVMAYHVVTEGACWTGLIDGEAVRLELGDVVVYPRGAPHSVTSHPGLRGVVDMAAYAQPRDQQLPVFSSRVGGDVRLGCADSPPAPGSATLVCGFFGCDARPFNPLLASLPELLHIRARDGEDDRISQLVRFAVAESVDKRPGGEALLERLSETMFVELVRRYLEELPEDQNNWLAGLRDRYVGRALSCLHANPGEAWTIDRLADRVGLSRSALHERFGQFTGHAPMQYLSRWRMQVAAGLLRHSAATVASIAQEVGYESEASFSRAFRRETGRPPATWRREQVRIAS